MGLAFEPVDEVDNDVEAATGAAANAGSPDSYGQMRLAGSGRGRDILPDTRGRTRRFTTRFTPAVAAELRLCGVTRFAASQCWWSSNQTGQWRWYQNG